ncbi:hypothetical protein A2313_02050 [Candidatus Roizmanbacteria bacterium RIFOXYB2_FULL_41_10]|uniref:Glycosyltransferase RgtA/B/C/D-like domain-containing protein n=1 Tax=Candidatus Roizmanbacteria bacterium RIFOXYA1_FULL_41_12 TaxID=1802082 RepID=A0A1F7KA49_9BACT|nr:MAG: hypothetical protein A2209_00295 [Candidatus Roizmanbacteria bacterium RIFOXYA1_FULL_41_12]OGK67569.1 MAG: hypothetical protein A2377_01850 [Candidatus Roizmanbacteria bacterium RIFOXYB1_FULL_41_27]OGK68393.1 MAG: hypothetical protein A2262_00880 [Candidatus Roizmanbacteria bacterium RIFOXYA2_FULL_41_8]OGK70974.1 MAG: hypothetical protein A2313_02050 [Candidatus Roizmanbacteria bacterium RIFOXYB2_FULL_41_10]OGK71225.1 MAG: hypothetical protein A2403_00580 [Candidatus Roizmanbacteria bac
MGKFFKIKPVLFYLITISIILFVLTRINPLLSHNVAYTYDQGRDFLSASEIVDQKNLTLIGPTTGIIGLFHGAWWYYLLTIPYILFQGLPIGFYYFNAIIHLLSLVALLVFAYIELGFIIALFAALIIISSPYFILTSLFVGNNIMAVPSVLALVISLYYLVKPKREPKPLLFFINALALGFVSEFELSFGLFLIPSYLFIILIFPILRHNFFKLKNFLWFMLGIGIVFLPRFLFELKHNLSQTKILLGFFLKPKLHEPRSFFIVIGERWSLFQSYYESLFDNQIILLVVSVFLLGLILHSIYKKQLKLPFKVYLTLLIFLFVISLSYKDNFWGNYYEGIHYLFLMIVLLIIGQNKHRFTKLFLILINGLLILMLLIKLLSPSKPTTLNGLAAHEAAVDYIYSQEGAKSLINIYTPPAIPYTYRYLFYYQHRFHKQDLPTDQWHNNQGWFIIESDELVDRRQAWIDTRIPQEAKLIKNKKIADIEIQLWQNRE